MAGALLGWEYTSFGQSAPVGLRLPDGTDATLSGHRLMTAQPEERMHQLWMLATLGISG